MSYLDTYIEGFSKRAEEESYDLEAELALIRKAQDGDKIAYKQLVRKFRGAINSGINQSGVNQKNISKDTLQASAMKEFNRSIMTFNPDSGAKPSTWIINNVSNDLKKLDTRYKNRARVSDASTIKMGNIQTAMKQLSAIGIEQPTSEQIQKQVLESYDKELRIDEIDSLLTRTRDELSGSSTMDTSGDSGAMTFNDVAVAEDKSGEDYARELAEADKLNGALGGIDDQSRSFYEQYKGLGKYKDQQPKKLSDLAKEFGFKSEHFAKKEVSAIEEQLRRSLSGDKPTID